jgi:hypothetical protein
MRLFDCLTIPSSRTCVSAVVLLAYTVTAAGVPIPTATRSQKNGEPYPCMAGNCGCNTAEQCWRSCCCHSLAERLAWAHTRGIQPPAFALARARALGLDLPWLAASDNPSKQARSCCDSHGGKAHSCYAEQHIKTAATKGDERVVGWRVLACRGLSLHWLAAVPTLIVVRPEASQEMSLIDRLGPAPSEVAGGRSQVPAVPPPEQA